MLLLPISNLISSGQFSINLCLISLTVVILFKGKFNTIFIPSLLANKKDNAIDGVLDVRVGGGFCAGVGVVVVVVVVVVGVVVGSGETLAVEEFVEDMILRGIVAVKISIE